MNIKIIDSEHEHHASFVSFGPCQVSVFCAPHTVHKPYIPHHTHTVHTPRTPCTRHTQNIQNIQHNSTHTHNDNTTDTHKHTQTHTVRECQMQLCFMVHLEPTRMRWENGQVNLTSLKTRQVCKSATVSSLCTIETLSLSLGWLCAQADCDTHRCKNKTLPYSAFWVLRPTLITTVQLEALQMPFIAVLQKLASVHMASSRRSRTHPLQMSLCPSAVSRRSLHDVQIRTCREFCP